MFRGSRQQTNYSTHPRPWGAKKTRNSPANPPRGDAAHRANVHYEKGYVHARLETGPGRSPQILHLDTALAAPKPTCPPLRAGPDASHVPVCRYRIIDKSHKDMQPFFPIPGG